MMFLTATLLRTRSLWKNDVLDGNSAHLFKILDHRISPASNESGLEAKLHHEHQLQRHRQYSTVGVAPTATLLTYSTVGAAPTCTLLRTWRLESDAIDGISIQSL